MEKQSAIVKGLHAALDELELLAIEGEIADIDVIAGLQEKFEKIKQLIQQQNKK